MIEKNLGNVERMIRLCAGASLMLWLAIQQDVSGMDWFIATIALFLFLNGVFSRCYLWFVLDIDTKKSGATRCASSQIPGY